MAQQYDGAIIIDLQLQQDDFEKRLSDIENKTNNFGTKIKSLLAGLGIVKISKDFISAGVNYNIAMQNYTAGLTTLLGSAEAAEAMITDLKEYAAKTPFEMSDLSSATQTLLSFGVAQQDVMGIMKMLGDVSLGDQQKFQSLALVFGQVSSQGKLMGQDLLQMINAGFNPLQIITEKTGESMSSLKDKMSKGEIGINEVTQAFQWATQEGGKFYGGMDRGSQTLSGQISTLKDNFNSFAGEAVKPLTDFATNTLIPALNEVFKHGDDILDILSKLMPVIVTITAGFVAFKSAIMIAGLVSKLSVAISGLKIAFLTLSNLGIGGTIKMLMGFASPVALVVAGVAALVAGFLYLWNTSEGFRKFWIELWNTITTFFSDCWTNILEFFTVTIPEAWENFKLKLSELGESIKQIFADAWNGIISFFTETIPAWIQSAIDWFNKLPYYIGFAIGAVIGTVAKWGLNLIDFATKDIPKFITDIADWFSKLPGKIKEWLLKSWQDIKTWGYNIYTSAKEWVMKTIDNVVQFFRELPGKIWTWLVESATKVYNWGMDLYNKGTEAAQQLWDSIVTKIQELPGEMLSIGKNLVEGLWNGISDMGSWIKQKIGDFADGIVNGFKSFFGIHSPSTLMRDAIGKFLPPGIAVGFDLALPKSMNNIDQSLDSMTDSMQRKIDLNMNDLQASTVLETNAKMSMNKEIVNSFPKTMRIIDSEKQPIIVYLDTSEVAHVLAVPLNEEIALLGG